MKIPESTSLPRLTLRSMGEEILLQLNLEKGLGYTIKMLIIAPGIAIQEYLFEDRRRMMRPLPLVLLLTAIATFLSFQFLSLEEGFNQSISESVQKTGLPENMIPLFTLLQKLAKQYFNIILMSGIPFMALTLYWLFRSARLYYAEHLVITMYIFSIQTLLLILFLPAIAVVPWIAPVILIFILSYMTYAFTHIFQVSWRRSLGKSILFILLSQLVQNIVVTLVALIIWFFFL